MIRRLLIVAYGISLLVWISLIVLWLSGYLLGWRGEWENEDRDRLRHSQRQIEISGGGICLSEFRMRVSADEKDFARTYAGGQFDPPVRGWGHKLGNDYPTRWGSDKSRWALVWKTSIERPYLVTRRAVIFPGWALLVPGGILIVAWVVFRRKPRITGRCSNCGYDLRASADRCPECGTPVPSDGRTPG